MKDFTHFDEGGASRMVDVGEKEISRREARASARVRMKPETLAAIRDQTVGKGDVLGVARLAGIMAAKRTGNLIPLCHPLPIESAEIAFEYPDDQTVLVVATVGITARTGVEMESLVAASTAALTIYDMCKSTDRAMVIDQLQLEEKSGGRSGHFRRES
jgi:cyclic pyranopterin phosphate synthase